MWWFHASVSAERAHLLQLACVPQLHLVPRGSHGEEVASVVEPRDGAHVIVVIAGQEGLNASAGGVPQKDRVVESDGKDVVRSPVQKV